MQRGRAKQNDFTHGIDITVDNIPILVPMRVASDIRATHGGTTAMTPPLEKPYNTVNAITSG